MPCLAANVAVRLFEAGSLPRMFSWDLDGLRKRLSACMV